MSDNLTPANLDKVIAMMNRQDGSKPWTKKDSCKFLGISYNVSRLKKLLDIHQEKIIYNASRRKANRGKKATESEILYVLQAYIDGDSLEDIGSAIYRGTAFVKTVLDNNGVFTRPVSHDYHNPEMIPEQSCRDRFQIGEVVYSTKYNSFAEVILETVHAVHGYVYRIRIKGDHQRFAYTPAYEMASLSNLKDLGVNV